MLHGVRNVAHGSVSEHDVTPVIAIGVLTWNGYEKARACVESLVGLIGWPVPVVIVDNGSREREGERLVREFGPPLEAVTLSPNRAVAGGYNAALRWGVEHGASHMLLLNNDTVATDPRLLQLLAAAAVPGVAAVAPVSTGKDGSVFSAGGRISWTTGLSGHRHTRLVDDRPYAVPWLDGACLLVSLNAVRQIGGLDPVFVSYWEDADWCTRAGRAGYRCLVEPRASIVHLRGGTVPSFEAERNDLRNGILFMRRHGGRASNLTSFVFFVIVRTPIHIARRSRSRARLAVALRAVRSAIAWNMRDAKRRGGWRVEPGGPTIDEMPTPLS